MAIELRDYQTEAIDNTITGWSKRLSVLVVLATGLGKCLGRGTPVLMYDGTIKPVEDVKEGDLLIGPDSRPRTVLSACSGVEPLYRVVPAKGDPYVVNESHILSLRMTPRRAGEASQVVNVGVRDYLEANDHFRHRAKGWRSGVEWPEQAVPLEPYFLGLWLGDGVQGRPYLAKPDAEVRAYVEGYAARLGLRYVDRVRRGKCPVFGIVGQRKRLNPVTAALRRLGVIDNKSVPLIYRRNSKAVRLEVLAGLMDTDGSLIPGGGYDFVSVSRELAEGVAFLARSCGLAAYLSSCEKSCQGGFVGTYWRVGISGHCDMIPCRIARKVSPARRQVKDALVHGIKLEPIGPGEYFGFEIDGDRLFLLGDFTVTHNTTVFAELIRRRPGRALVIAHREELISQAAERIADMTGEPVGVEMGSRSVHEGYSLAPPRVVVSSVQTLSRPKRLHRFRCDAFRTVVADECHHSTSASWRTVLDHFSTADILGVTATPIRGDGAKLGSVFQHVAADKGIKWAVQNGWLVPVVPRLVKVDGLDFSKVRTAAGDWSAADLDATLSAEEPLHKIAVPTVELSAGGPTLVFCAGVNQARALSGVINRYRPGSSHWLCGETDRDERKAMIADYLAGRVNVLVNVGVLTEGFDAPMTSHVVLARPTKSLALYVQILGRGTRTAPGVVDGLDTPEARVAAIRSSEKPTCTVLDFVGSTGKLDPSQVTAADIFGEDEAPAVKAKLKELLARAAGKEAKETVTDLFERAAKMAAAESRLMAQEDERLRRVKADSVSYRVEDVGAIEVGDQRMPSYAEPATPAQRNYLRLLGVPWEKTARISKSQARGWIGRIETERKQAKGAAS